MSALRDAIAAKAGIETDTVDATEVAKITAAIDGIRLRLIDVADRHDTADTLAIVEAFRLGIPAMLQELEANPAAARAFLHGHAIGDPTAALPGIAPVAQHTNTTPVAALGAGTGGTTPAGQDPAVAEFVSLLTSNRGAALALLDHTRAAIDLQASNPPLYQLVSTALLNLLAAATKPEPALSPEERQWVLVENGGQPELKAHRDARQAASAATTELNRVTGPIREIVSSGWFGALNAAKWMADEIAAHRGGSVNPSDAAPLGRTLEAIKSNIEAANTSSRPRAARLPNS